MGSGNSVPSVEDGSIQSHVKVLEFFLYKFPFRKYPLADDATLEEQQVEDAIVFDLVVVLHFVVLSLHNNKSAAMPQAHQSRANVYEEGEAHREQPMRLRNSDSGAMLTAAERRRCILPLLCSVHFTDALRLLATRVQELDGGLSSSSSSLHLNVSKGPLGDRPLVDHACGGLSGLLFEVVAILSTRGGPFSVLDITIAERADVLLYFRSHPPPVVALSYISSLHQEEEEFSAESSLEERMNVLVHAATCCSYYGFQNASKHLHADTMPPRPVLDLSLVIANSLGDASRLQHLKTAMGRQATVTALVSLVARIWLSGSAAEANAASASQQAMARLQATRTSNDWSALTIWLTSLLTAESMTSLQKDGRGEPGSKPFSVSRGDQSEALTYTLRLFKAATNVLNIALLALESSTAVADAHYGDEQFEAAVCSLRMLEALYSCGVVSVLVDDDVRNGLSAATHDKTVALSVSGGEAASMRKSLVQLIGRTGCLLSSNDGAYRMATLTYFVLSEADDADTFTSLDLFDMLLYLSRISTAPHAVEAVAKCLTCVVEEEWMREVENDANTDATASNIAPTAILSALMSVGTHIATMSSALEVFKGVEAWLKAHVFAAEVTLSSRDTTWFAECVIRGIRCAREEALTMSGSDVATDATGRPEVADVAVLEFHTKSRGIVLLLQCILRVLHTIVVRSGTLHANLIRACTEQDHFPEAVLHGLLDVVLDDESAAQWLHVVEQIVRVVPPDRCFAPKSLTTTTKTSNGGGGDAAIDEEVREEDRQNVLHNGVRSALVSVLHALDGCCTSAECAAVGCRVLSTLLAAPITLVSRPWNFFVKCDRDFPASSLFHAAKTAEERSNVVDPVRVDILHSLCRLAQLLPVGSNAVPSDAGAVDGDTAAVDWINAMETFVSALVFRMIRVDSSSGSRSGQKHEKLITECSCVGVGGSTGDLENSLTFGLSEEQPHLVVNVSTVYHWSVEDHAAISEALKQLVAVGLHVIPPRLESLLVLSAASASEESSGGPPTNLPTEIESLTQTIVRWCRCWTLWTDISPEAAAKARRETAASRWCKLFIYLMECGIAASSASTTATTTTTPHTNSSPPFRESQHRSSSQLRRTQLQIMCEVTNMIEAVMHRSFLLPPRRMEREGHEMRIAADHPPFSVREAEREFASLLVRQHEGRQSPLRRHRSTTGGGKHHLPQVSFRLLEGKPFLDVFSAFLDRGVSKELLFFETEQIPRCRNVPSAIMRLLVICASASHEEGHESSSSGAAAVTTLPVLSLIEFLVSPCMMSSVITFLKRSCCGWFAAVLREVTLSVCRLLAHQWQNTQQIGTSNNICDVLLRPLITAEETTTGTPKTMGEGLAALITLASDLLVQAILRCSQPKRNFIYETEAVVMATTHLVEAIATSLRFKCGLASDATPVTDGHRDLGAARWLRTCPVALRIAVLQLYVAAASSCDTSERSRRRSSVSLSESIRTTTSSLQNGALRPLPFGELAEMLHSMHQLYSVTMDSTTEEENGVADAVEGAMQQWVTSSEVTLFCAVMRYHRHLPLSRPSLHPPRPREESSRNRRSAAFRWLEAMAIGVEAAPDAFVENGEQVITATIEFLNETLSQTVPPSSSAASSAGCFEDLYEQVQWAATTMTLLLETPCAVVASNSGSKEKYEDDGSSPPSPPTQQFFSQRLLQSSDVNITYLLLKEWIRLSSFVAAATFKEGPSTSSAVGGQEKYFAGDDAVYWLSRVLVALLEEELESPSVDVPSPAFSLPSAFRQWSVIQDFFVLHQPNDMVALGDNLAASGLGSQQPSICSAAPFFALMTPPAAHNASLDSSSWSEDTTEMWLRAVFSVVSLERRGNGTAAVIPASRVAANVRQGSSLHNSTTVFRTALVRDGLANAVACCFSLTADAVRYFSDIVVVLFSENSNATDSMHALVRLYGSQVNIRNAFYRCLTHGLLRLHEMSMKMENGLLEPQQPTTCRSQEELDDTFVSWCTSVTCIVNAADQLAEDEVTNVTQEVLSPRDIFFTSELVELFNRTLPFMSSVRGGLFYWCQLLCSLTSPPASAYDDTTADGGLRMLSSSTDPLLLCDALLTTAFRLLDADKSWRRPPERRSRHAVETLHDTTDDRDEDFEGVFSTITSALNVVLPAVNGTHNAERIILCRELLSVLCDVVAASSSFHIGLPTASLHVSRCIITAAVKSHVIAMLGEVAISSPPEAIIADKDFLLSFLRMIHSRVYMALLSISAATRGGGMLSNNGNSSQLLFDKVSSCVPWICGALSNLLDVRDNASRMLNILFHGWYVVLSVDHLGSSIMSHDVRVAQQPASTVFCDDRDTSKLRDEHADDTERQVYSPRLCGSLLSEVLLGLSTACEGSNATRWFFSMLSKLSTPLLQDDHVAKNDIDVVVLQASVEGFTHRKLHQEVCRLLTTQVLGPEAIISACRWVTTLCSMLPMTTAHAQPIFSAKILHSVCVCAKQIITHVDCAVAVLDAIDALLSASAKDQQPVVETDTAADDAEEGFARVTHEVQSTVLALQSLCSSPRSREALRRALCALCLTADGTAIMFDSEASVSLFRDAMLRTFAFGDVRDSESDLMTPADLFATCRAFAALANHCPYDTLLQDERLGLLWIRLCQRLASDIDDMRHNAANQPPVITSPASSSPLTASSTPLIPQDEAACSLMQCLEALCRRSVSLTALILGGRQHRVEAAPAFGTSGEGGDRNALPLSGGGSVALYHLLLWLFPWMTSPTSAAACRAIEAAASEPSARLCLSTLRFVGLFTKVLAPVAATATGSDTSACVAWACAVNRITLQTSASFPEPKIAATSVVSASPLRKPSAAQVERDGGEGHDDDVIRSRFATREMHDAIMLLSTPLCCYCEDASSVMWKCSVLIHLTATDEHVSVFWTEALRNWILVHAIPTVGNALSAAVASTSSRSDPKSTGQLTNDRVPPASSPTTRWALTKTFSKAQLVGMSKSFRESGLPIEIEPARWLCGAIANLTLREEGRRLYLSSYPNIFLQLLPLASAVPTSSEATRWMLAVLCNLTSWSPITSKNLNANDNHHSSHHSPSSSSNSLVDTLQIVVPTMLRLCATAIVDEGGVRLLCIAYRQVFATIESLGGGTTSSSSNVSTHSNKSLTKPASVGSPFTNTADLTGRASSTTPEFDVVALSRMVPMIETPTVASDLFLAFLALPMPLLSTRRCRVLRVADTVTTTTTTSLALSRSSSGSSSEFVPVATKAAQRNTTTSQTAMVVAANDEGCIVLDGSDLVADAIIDLSMLSAKWDTAAYHLAKLALRIMTADPLPKKHTRHALRRALAAIISVVGESRSTINVDDKTTETLQNAFSVVSSDKII